MSTKKNKSVVSQALLEMDEITTAIKEESKKSISNLLSEAVVKAIRESCNEDDENDYEIEDAEKNDADIDVSGSDESAESEDNGDVISSETEEESEEMLNLQQNLKKTVRKHLKMVKTKKMNGISSHNIK